MPRGARAITCTFLSYIARRPRAIHYQSGALTPRAPALQPCRVRALRISRKISGRGGYIVRAATEKKNKKRELEHSSKGNFSPREKYVSRDEILRKSERRGRVFILINQWHRSPSEGDVRRPECAPPHVSNRLCRCCCCFFSYFALSAY